MYTIMMKNKKLSTEYISPVEYEKKLKTTMIRQKRKGLG
jgi:hypothetical protein